MREFGFFTPSRALKQLVTVTQGKLQMRPHKNLLIVNFMLKWLYGKRPSAIRSHGSALSRVAR